MLCNSFSIFPGIGPKIERYLWRMGVLSWDDFLGRERIPGFSPSRKSVLDRYVAAASDAYASGNIRYFKPLLGPSETWRLWEPLAADSICLDIETDGRRAGEGYVTVAGFYSHGEYRPYIAGVNLTQEAIEEELEGAKLLVTYSGNGFDLPYLRDSYPSIRIDLPHLDLCPVCHKAGLKGGLKKVEELVGIGRDDSVKGMSGYQAVLLWRAHLGGASGALDTLVSYNREDTANLHTLAWKLFERLTEAAGFPGAVRSR